jgi:hypothetical protein
LVRKGVAAVSERFEMDQASVRRAGLAMLLVNGVVLAGAFGHIAGRRVAKAFELALVEEGLVFLACFVAALLLQIWIYFRLLKPLLDYLYHSRVLTGGPSEPTQ